MQLSIVVPVYNVENYVLACLESIKNSLSKVKSKEIEIIVVDDGSTDRSGKMAKKFCDLNEEFNFYSKKNGGLSDARNFGLSKIQGKYVGFIDSDDLIDKKYFDIICKNINESNLDLYIFDWFNLYIDGESEIIKGIDLEEELWTVAPSAWNKIYRADFFENIKFPEGKWYEDVGTTYILIDYVNSYKYIKESLYIYRKNREGSILTTTSYKINDIYEVLDRVYKYYFENNKLTEINLTGLSYQYVKLLLWSNMYRQLKYFKFNFKGFNKKMEETNSIVSKKFPKWKENILLLQNKNFFISRIGKNYLNTLDQIGRGVFQSLFSIITIVFKMKISINKK